MRKLLNAAWIALAIDAGVDAGIIDPITSHPANIAKIDPTSQAFIMAKAAWLSVARGRGTSRSQPGNGCCCAA